MKQGLIYSGHVSTNSAHNLGFLEVHFAVGPWEAATNISSLDSHRSILKRADWKSFQQNVSLRNLLLSFKGEEAQGLAAVRLQQTRNDCHLVNNGGQNMEAATPAVSSKFSNSLIKDKQKMAWKALRYSQLALPSWISHCGTLLPTGKTGRKRQCWSLAGDRKMVRPVTFQIGFSKRPPFKNIENISLGRIHEMFHHVLCTRLHLLCF